MDRTESPVEEEGSVPGTGTRKGSQSKPSPILLWIFLAAVLFRIVTAVTDRGTEKKSLVSWIPAEKVAAAARAGSRPILYDFTADWCAPCHVLDREGWNDRQIAALVNARFAPARIVDRQKEEGRNTAAIAELQRRYGVEGFPTLVVAAPDGREIAKFGGWRGREALATFLRASLTKAGS